MLRKMWVMDSFLRGVGGDPILSNNPHFHLPYKKATVPRKKHSSFQGNVKEINSPLME
jgi:hypothetical protein